MKKLLSVVILSLSLLVSSASLTNANNTNIILQVQSSNYDPYSNLYISEVLTENGDLYTIQSYDDISNQWLDATITEQGEITNYTIMD